MDIKDMKVEEVADLINNALQGNKGVSVNKICDTLRIKRSTLKSRLTRGGYSFNAEHNKYELITTEENINNTTDKTSNEIAEDITRSNVIDITNKAIEHTIKENMNSNDNKITENTTKGNTSKINDKDTEHITEDNRNNSKVSTKHTTDETIKSKIIQTTEHTTKEKTRKLTIDERITALERAVEMLKGNTRKTTKGITITNTKDTTVKSIRLYKEVKEELDKYIANHKEIKVIDIISNAIMEYIKRH